MCFSAVSGVMDACVGACWLDTASCVLINWWVVQQFALPPRPSLHALLVSHTMCVTSSNFTISRGARTPSAPFRGTTGLILEPTAQRTVRNRVTRDTKVTNTEFFIFLLIFASLASIIRAGLYRTSRCPRISRAFAQCELEICIHSPHNTSGYKTCKIINWWMYISSYTKWSDTRKYQMISNPFAVFTPELFGPDLIPWTRQSQRFQDNTVWTIQFTLYCLGLLATEPWCSLLTVRTNTNYPTNQRQEWYFFGRKRESKKYESDEAEVNMKKSQKMSQKPKALLIK